MFSYQRANNDAMEILEDVVIEKKMGSKLAYFLFAFSIVVSFVSLFILSTSTLSRSTQKVSYDLENILYNVDPKDTKEKIKIKVVFVYSEDGLIKTFSRNGTTLSALNTLGYKITKMHKVVSTSPKDSLYEKTYIRIYTYKTTIEELEKELPYATINQGLSLCSVLGSHTVEQEGVLGIQTTVLRKIFEDGNLIAEEVLEQYVKREPVPEIIVLHGPDDTPSEVPQRGYDCGYWYAYVDSMAYSDDEKRWLKFIMYCESGCNAESNGGYYKGLFQWDPCLWYKLYPNENIFSGEAQINHTIEKYRAGAARMWPACNNRFNGN